MRGPKLTLRFEHFVPVLPFYEKTEHDHSAAFNLASQPGECLRQVRAQLRDPKWGGFQPNELRRLKVTAEFVEFDASNPYHANAVFSVSVMTPAAYAEQVRDAGWDTDEDADQEEGS